MIGLGTAPLRVRHVAFLPRATEKAYLCAGGGTRLSSRTWPVRGGHWAAGPGRHGGQLG